MKKEDLAKAITDIDEKYILEAYPENDAGSGQGSSQPSRKARKYRFLPAAAAACLALIIGIGALRMTALRSGKGQDTATMMEEKAVEYAEPEMSQEAFEEPANMKADNASGTAASDISDQYAEEEAADMSAESLWETESESGTESDEAGGK